MKNRRFRQTDAVVVEHVVVVVLSEDGGFEATADADAAFSGIAGATTSGAGARFHDDHGRRHGREPVVRRRVGQRGGG